MEFTRKLYKLQMQNKKLFIYKIVTEVYTYVRI